MKKGVNIVIAVTLLFVGALLGKDLYNKKLKEKHMLMRAIRQAEREERAARKPDPSIISTNRLHTRKYIRIK